MKKFAATRLAIIPFILIFLPSCFTAKQYVRPDQVVEEAYFRTDELPRDSLSMAELSWQDLFNDRYLIGYIEEGLENNMDIRIALEQINAAEAYYRQGRAGWYPDLNVGLQGGRQWLSENGAGGGSINQFELSGTLSWEADIWGRIRSSMRASEAAYLQTVAAHQAVKTELIANIASVYFQLLSLDEQKRITEETISNRESGLETTLALMDAGQVNAAGVKQTEAQLYTARAILIDIERGIKLLENTLSMLLGSEPREIPRGTLDDLQLSPDIEVGYPIQLLANRPDVMASEYNLIRSFELVNVARSNFYPSLTLSAGGGLQSTELDNLFSANSLFASIFGSLTQPIFNRRQIQTGYEVALSEQEQAYLRFRQSILNAGREVSDALYSYQAAEERMSVEAMELSAYEEALEYSEELLNNGMVNYLEVLTAQERTLNSQLNLASTRYERLDAVIELYRALGGGWQ